jgi:hypothetical protein
LTGYQAQARRNTKNASTAGLVVCLVLMALIAVVQVAHVHLNSNDSNQCTLCVVMHSAAPVAEAAAIVVLVQLGISEPVIQVRSVVRHWHPQLFTRPPPTDS